MKKISLSHLLFVLSKMAVFYSDFLHWKKMGWSNFNQLDLEQGMFCKQQITRTHKKIGMLPGMSFQYIYILKGRNFYKFPSAIPQCFSTFNIVRTTVESQKELLSKLYAVFVINFDSNR